MSEEMFCERCGKRIKGEPFVEMVGEQGNTTDGMLFVCEQCYKED